MSKKDLIRSVAKSTGLSLVKVEPIVNAVVDSIMTTIIESGLLNIQSLGSFKTRTRKAHNSVNPRTGEKIQVPERKFVFFKASKEFQERVRQ